VKPDPRSDAAVWDELERWRAEGRRFVLATVTESRGFTPRKPGAHMLIGEDGATAGTIGGGAIEREVIEAARERLAGSGSATLRRHLTQELGMCCGGEMAIFLEVIEAAPKLLVFGAGYIARPLAALAATCGFAVRVVDERADWATGERFPTSEVVVREPEAFLRDLEIRGDEFAVVVTHDHALDQRLVQILLRRPLKFVGMIGSVAKQRKFALRLRAKGFGDAEIARLQTPLGVSIGADTPEEIAVSVMAQIVAVRRGANAPAGWTPPARREIRSAEAGVEAVPGSASESEEERV
jgi:xanthine dehydrogenase accessory factor